VGDEDDREALSGQAFEGVEEPLRLVRRQHRRRLVENEEIHVAVERLQDLHALLLTDVQLPDARPDVDVEPVLLREVRDALFRNVETEREPPRESADDAVLAKALGKPAILAFRSERRRRFPLAEDDVLGHGQPGDEHEVLVDHADAALDGVLR